MGFADIAVFLSRDKFFCLGGICCNAARISFVGGAANSICDHLLGDSFGLMGSFLPQTQQLEAMFSAILILRLIVGYDSKSSFVAQLDGRTCLDYIDNPMRPMGCVV